VPVDGMACVAPTAGDIPALQAVIASKITRKMSMSILCIGQLYGCSRFLLLFFRTTFLTITINIMLIMVTNVFIM
jgi:hypothetical protein